MIELTQQQIDNAPEWATDYFIYEGVVIYYGGMYSQREDSENKIRRCGGVADGAVPINRT